MICANRWRTATHTTIFLRLTKWWEKVGHVPRAQGKRRRPQLMKNLNMPASCEAKHLRINSNWMTKSWVIHPMNVKCAMISPRSVTVKRNLRRPYTAEYRDLAENPQRMRNTITLQIRLISSIILHNRNFFLEFISTFRRRTPKEKSGSFASSFVQTDSTWLTDGGCTWNYEYCTSLRQSLRPIKIKLNNCETITEHVCRLTKNIPPMRINQTKGRQSTYSSLLFMVLPAECLDSAIRERSPYIT